MRCIILYKDGSRSGWKIGGPYESQDEAAFSMGELCESGITGRIVSTDEIASSIGIISNRG
jgi:hypothetical protein